jgi:hypothetical protein
MSASGLCHELLTTIFEYVHLETSDGGVQAVSIRRPSPSQPVSIRRPSQPATSKRDGTIQHCDLPAKRARSSSEQQQVTTLSSQAPLQRAASSHGILSSAARVCKAWNSAATKILYRDPGTAISRYEGLYSAPLVYLAQGTLPARLCSGFHCHSLA